MKNHPTPFPRQTSIRRLVILGINLVAVALASASAQTTIIEENFDEATPGTRIVAGVSDISQTGLRPDEGKIYAFAGDEAEIVEGWSKNALQFQDKIVDAALKLRFSAAEIDPITSGKLEISLEFQITGEVGESPHAYEENPLVVSLSAPTQSDFLTVTVYRENGKIYHTNNEEAPSWVNMTQGATMNPGTVYRLQLNVSLDKASYDITVTEKESGTVAWQAIDQPYVTIPELTANGLGADLLSVQAGSPDFSRDREPPVRVTVDNIRINHTENSQ